MKKTIRFGVWETNSSSVHNFCICTEEEFKKWEDGELFYDDYKEELTKKEFNHWDEDNYKYDQWFNEKNEWFDVYDHHFTTPSGDKMVIFGYYGHD